MGARASFHDEYLLIKLYDEMSATELQQVFTETSTVLEHVSFLFVCVQDLKVEGAAFTGALKLFKDNLLKKESVKVCFISKDSPLADAPDHKTALGKINTKASSALFKLHEIAERLGSESAKDLAAKVERLEEKVKSMGIDPNASESKDAAESFKNEPLTEDVAQLEAKVFAELGQV